MLGKTAFKIFTFLLLGLIALKFLSFYNMIPKIQDTKSVEKTDAIVVFTGGNKRVQAAFDLFEKRHAELLFVSGVPKGVTKRKLLKVSHSSIVDLSTVQLGSAENTQENAEEVSKWARDQNIRSIRLVTTTFHMPRALREMRLKTENLVVIPHPISADMPIYAAIYYYFSEFVKLTLLEMGIEYPEKQSIF
ncbi:MAG: hypothetical protein COY39_05155 [Alphaproteobacteria bacterium CG_4_10_14_0_8_um_filter_37_21]|nr:MAG: hypothetical protein COY39_05155 [Alphaproteobacteria bacterium CG_4_10_14_0_8_um_filter_37_21]